MNNSSNLFQTFDQNIQQAGALFILILFVSGTAGCAAGLTPPTSIAGCLPDSVFTAAEMQARVDCHPSDYKYLVSRDTTVLFAFPDPLIDWVGPIFIIHVPSVSEAVVNTDGSLFTRDYKSAEGQAAIERILNDPGLMAKILERAKEIKLGTLVPATTVR